MVAVTPTTRELWGEPTPPRPEPRPPWWLYAIVIVVLLITLPLWPAFLLVWWILKALGVLGAAATVPLWGFLHPASRRAPWWG